MTLSDFPMTGALARAAERWQRAFLIGNDTPLPQLADLAIRRENGDMQGRKMPSPFRPRRG